MNSQLLIDSGYFIDLADMLRDTEIVRGPHKGKKSKYSKSIMSDGDNAWSLFSAFKLNGDSNFESFKKAYEMAIGGDGDEESKILTIHSSSLLALLCFFSVSPTCPLIIGKDEYTEAMFEVKNTVIKKDGRKPSNIDVLLVSRSEDGRVRKLLFLESKFTEYFKHGRVALAAKYHPFFQLLNKRIPDLKFNISDYKINHKDGTKSKVFGLWSDESKYLEGIKQVFSHLLGIATRPAQDRKQLRKHYVDYYYQAKEIEFATIVHDWNKNTTEFDRYRNLYADTFKTENSAIIKDIIKECAPNRDIVERLRIHAEILTYREIFKGFNLPGIVKTVYIL